MVERMDIDAVGDVTLGGGRAGVYCGVATGADKGAWSTRGVSTLARGESTEAAGKVAPWLSGVVRQDSRTFGVGTEAVVVVGVGKHAWSTRGESTEAVGVVGVGKHAWSTRGVGIEAVGVVGVGKHA